MTQQGRWMVIRRDFLLVNGRRLARGWCAIGLSAVLSACGNGTSPGDAAVDVREDGDFNFPRSAFCSRLEDSGYRYGFQSYCRLGAAEGERCKFDPTIDTSASGYCASVTASTGGAFAAYDRNHRVPKICVLNEPNAPAWCPQYGEGQPVDAPNNNCVPEAQAQCVRFYPPDSGYRWACVPYHCD